MKYNKNQLYPVLSQSLLVITAGLIGFLFLFGFLYENIDGYQYWAFGEYLRTGVYPFVWPMMYAKPTTVSPPLYSAILAFVGHIQRGDIPLHLLQLFFYCGAGFYLFKTLLFFIKKEPAIIAACLTSLIPGSIIYTGYLMTENGVQFFLTLYIFLFFSWLKTKHILPLSLSVFVGIIMGLWKYSFLIYGFLSLGMFLLFHPKKIAAYLFPFIGVLILMLWIIYNHTITNVWGLLDTKYMYAHMVLIWEGKVVPNPDNPATKRFRSYVPDSVPIHDGYWTFLPYILPKVNGDWTKVDEIVGGMGMGAIKEYPFEYVKTVIKIFFETHNHGIPYWSNLSRFGNDDPQYPLYCQTLGTLQFCAPIIKTPWTYPIWNAFVRLSDWFYVWIFPFWSMGIFFPMLIVCLIHKNAFFRWLGILFLIGRIPISMSNVAESRYLVPFYPLMAIITVAGIKQSILWLKRKTENIKRSF